ncbi:LacI family transcriptional regulator [Pontibacillus chungwhensis BH030062]|uniref:LacI family transcriptional regulator n=1 Tax=Pontibacillus chungwhensis BH030062 TaxID=1385513 RepID=A0A0A2UZU2_9BACI|nr:LacI family DNA-binding transcriptional regulator [Pontibacillus chungwhensis]KGP92288.1 LacI family transcriptional regulator [Pontibacillus chungwhensis BH030062]
MVTIYDIAKKTGFSVTTVSKVLNNYSDVSEKTKKAIKAAVEEMDYLPNSHARTLTTKKSWTIGVVFIESLGIGVKHPFFNAVIESFRQEVEIEGYDLLFVSRNISNQKKSYLDHFRYRGVDGVVIVCSTYDDEQVKELIEDPIPTVVIDMSSDQSSVVYSDNYEGSRLAVDHLQSLGHTRIAHIAGHESTFAGEQRKKGFYQAMKALNLEVPDEYVVNGDYFSIEGGARAMKSLLELEKRPTAVYAAGDSLAMGAINAINEQGLRVPEDLSVVGYDDIELAQYIHPALTTIRQQTDLIGQESAKLLLKQIDCKESYVACTQVPVELIIRKSTGPVA